MCNRKNASFDNSPLTRSEFCLIIVIRKLKGIVIRRIDVINPYRIHIYILKIKICVGISNTAAEG